MAKMQNLHPKLQSLTQDLLSDPAGLNNQFEVNLAKIQAQFPTMPEQTQEYWAFHLSLMGYDANEFQMTLHCTPSDLTDFSIRFTLDGGS